MPKVSIIIPTYNSESTIERAVISCLHQTFKDIEVIVIDDGSMDSTRHIIKKIKDNRLRYYYFENSGRSKARNRGIENARGKYIQFLDSDDTLDILKIETAMGILNSDEKIDAIQCGTRYWKENKLVVESKASYRKNKGKLLLRQNIFPIHSVIFKKELASSFPENLSYCEDWFFWVKTLWKANIFFQPEYFGANVFIHHENTMTNYREMILGEIYILLRIKKEIACKSLLRDIKIIKQFIYYLINYNKKDLHEIGESTFTRYKLLKIIYYFTDIPIIRAVLKQVFVIKNKMIKKENLY
ncbi:glycosyltransferase family 2 protein [Bacillus sp. 1NLA3E]|uniref:glycosyltransferase family 2 protein n=1 Tax=Bacillus sp. 1NLA3E TaxID=666686 RepID=UPI000247EB91|nr:glycosyltransferase [Bacillus sp. 1NLA3E]